MTKHVEFVSYTGAYPNLCCGVLTLNIDGKAVRFGYGYNESQKPDYLPFWRSGGSVSFDNNWLECVGSGRWIISEYDLPDEYKCYTEEIDEVFNQNVPYGCCGGCV